MHPLYARESLGVLADYVTLEQGTGAVHTAPGHGADDFNTGQRYGLDTYAPIGPSGEFLESVELFAGLKVWDANPKVVEALRERGALWFTEKHEHSYPHCWRCHKPLIFLATPQWFIEMDHDGYRAEGARGGDARRVAAGVGRGAHPQHARQPARLVHLAPARLGCADPGRVVHDVPRVGADHRR